MDSDQDHLLRLLFPHADKTPAAASFDPTAVLPYIHRLGAYQVDDLVKEPHRLQEESRSIHERTQELAVTNYQTFIETAQCSRELFSQFDCIQSKLDAFVQDAIPHFERQCGEFTQQTGDITSLRKLNSVTLMRNAQLLEILELPQLMTSFVNETLYEDALELAGYVRRLHGKHPELDIFKSIARDVEKVWLVMLHQLLSQLRQDITLPKCLEIVGYLRRMDVFSETELRLKFLQTRNTFLQSQLNGISHADVSHHLNKTIEMTRVNLFNIVTQYRAIFNDDEHSPLTATVLKHQQHHNKVNQNVIFFSWIRDKISEFLGTLKTDLHRGAASIDSILSQCMYFGLSFSKVGSDFRSLMIPIFTEEITQRFANRLTNAGQQFRKSMECFTLINKNYPSVSWKKQKQQTENNSNPLHPPDTLLEFYPLSEFLNGVLVAFNELRLCAPIACVDKVVASLQDGLLVIAKSIPVLYAQEQQAFNTNSKEAFTRLCVSFADDLIFYIQKCVHVIFPPASIASALGVNVQILQENGVTFLDRSKIVEPIQRLLPVKTEAMLLPDNVNDDCVVIDADNNKN